MWHLCFREVRPNRNVLSQTHHFSVTVFGLVWNIKHKMTLIHLKVSTETWTWLMVKSKRFNKLNKVSIRQLYYFTKFPTNLSHLKSNAQCKYHIVTLYRQIKFVTQHFNKRNSQRMQTSDIWSFALQIDLLQMHIFCLNFTAECIIWQHFNLMIHHTKIFSNSFIRHIKLVCPCLISRNLVWNCMHSFYIVR